MPYSLDPEANKDNPISPNPLMSMESQLLYKVAGLEQSVRDMTRRLDEKFDRVIADLTNRHTDVVKDMTSLENRVESIKKEVDSLKEWRTSIVSKISVIGAAILIIWTIVGDTVKHGLGIT